MRPISLAIAILLLSAAGAAASPPEQVTGFGANPGALEMFKHVPPGAPAGAPLVVVLHGCSQTVAQIAPAGWDSLADEYGFYVLYPQQTTDNNPIRCFNWAGEYGDPTNLERGEGENESIKQMIDRMIADHAIDPDRLFIAGFSAGGAFAVVMLATWPDLFQAGAVMSGIPYRCATTVNGAYACQQIQNNPDLKHTPAEWGDLVRNAYPSFTGDYPRVALFHGTQDFIVDDDNQVELIDQWTDVLGLPLAPTSTATVAGHERSRWQQGGETIMESWRVAGMGHAISMGGADPDHPCPPSGGTYVEDRGLCAPWRAIAFFGLTGDVPQPGDPDAGPGDPPDPGHPDAGAPVPGAPSVTILAPGDGDEVDGAVTIEADASDDGGISRVEFWVDGVLKGSDGTPPYTQLWQTANASEGEHEIEAVAYDLYEVSTSDRVTVHVGAGGGAGGDELVDPIPCGCRATGEAGRAPASGALFLLAPVAVLILRRRGR